MKKIVALLICVLLVAALAIPALAADASPSITISADKSTAAKGETVTFTITASDLGHVKGLGIIPQFDAKVFKLVTGTADASAFVPVDSNAFFFPIVGFNPERGLFATFTVPAMLADTSRVIGTFTLEVIAECGAGSVTANANLNSTTPISVNTASVSVAGEHAYGDWTPNEDNHVHTCSKCGAEETAEHTWEGTVNVLPDCTHEGVASLWCEVCQASKTEPIPTNDNHSWNAGEITTQPGCETAGVKTYTCKNNAAHTYTESVAALQHSFEGNWKVEKKATCEVAGEERDYCANGCGKYESREIKATGHNWGAWEDFTPDKHQHYCPVCQTSETADHNWGDPTVIQKSTCTVPGAAEEKCDDCSTKKNYPLELDPTNHNGYTAVVTAPTCTEKGYTTHKCACGDEYVDTYVNPTGHKMGEWYVDVPATCEATGTDRRDCANCDYSEPKTTKALGHNYTSKVTKEATCKEEGILTYTCQNDQKHTYTETIAKATTHTASDETVVIKAPTCTEQGISSGKCAVCGVNMDEFKTNALGHDMGEWYVKTDSTCTAVGEERSDCSRCDYSDTKVIDKKDHSYEDVATAPTCTKNGYTTHTCSVCGNSYQTPGDKALGHEYTSKVTTEPGCETKGVETFTCVRGDDSYTKDIAATGHSQEGMEVTTPATCEKSGEMSGKCAACGKVLEKQVIPATGHDYEKTGEVAPTCTEKGSKTYTCKNDAAHTYSEEIPALGHTYGAWINVDGETHKHVCQVETCGHEETAAHKWDTGKVTVEPTHTETGIKTYECKDCHATREEVVDKTTKHEYDAKAEQIVDEEGNVDTKNHTGFCACGEQHKEKHSYDILGDVIKEPTATTKGEQEVFCACGHKVIAKIKADGTLDGEPGMGDITGQVVMTGIAAFSVIAAAAYVCIRKRIA